MKEINEMSEQEIKDAITKIKTQVEAGRYCDNVDVEVWNELNDALIHNFPHLIGGKDECDATESDIY